MTTRYVQVLRAIKRAVRYRSLDPIFESDAAFWNSLSKSSRQTLVLGVISGTSHGVMRALSLLTDRSALSTELSASEMEALWEEITPQSDPDAVVTAVSGIYHDPANAHIPANVAVAIADNWLRGQDVGAALAEARRDGLSLHEQFLASKR
jgi:hypothetical protein